MKKVRLNLDGKHPHYAVPQGLWSVDIDSDGRQDLDRSNADNSFHQCLSYEPGPLDWKQLSPLNKLGVLTYEGNDIAVLDYLSKSNCPVYDFTWRNHGQKQLDFSGSRKLHALAVEVPYKTFRLTLPKREGLRSLRILDPPPGCRLTVHAPHSGKGLLVDIVGTGLLRIPGLRQIEQLEIVSADAVDLDSLARAYPQLEAIHIRGRSVTLTGIASLARLNSLREMWFHGCYAMNAAEFPEPEQMPLLEEVAFDGLRAEDAVILKKKYRGVKQIAVCGKRSPEWIAANLDNPFRDWEEEFGRAAGNKAMKAWATADTELKQLNSADAAKGREILKAFVEVFNQMERRSGLETDQREMIYEVFSELASRLPSGSVTDEDYDEWAEYS
ncbi:MAG: hypothetical protein KDA89_04785 [Planctomycetaceae bacterium]|nr:hypothetical protein [Planctomycetaceae bacterium]